MTRILFPQVATLAALLAGIVLSDWVLEMATRQETDECMDRKYTLFFHTTEI